MLQTHICEQVAKPVLLRYHVRLRCINDSKVSRRLFATAVACIRIDHVVTIAFVTIAVVTIAARLTAALSLAVMIRSACSFSPLVEIRLAKLFITFFAIAECAVTLMRGQAFSAWEYPVATGAWAEITKTTRVGIRHFGLVCVWGVCGVWGAPCPNCEDAPDGADSYV